MTKKKVVSKKTSKKSIKKAAKRSLRSTESVENAASEYSAKHSKALIDALNKIKVKAEVKTEAPKVTEVQKSRALLCYDIAKKMFEYGLVKNTMQQAKANYKMDDNTFRSLTDFIVNFNSKTSDNYNDFIFSDKSNTYETPTTKTLNFVSTTFDAPEFEKEQFEKEQIEEDVYYDLIEPGYDKKSDSAKVKLSRLDEWSAKITTEYWQSKRKFVLMNKYLEYFYENDSFLDKKDNFFAILEEELSRNVDEDLKDFETYFAVNKKS